MTNPDYPKFLARVNTTDLRLAIHAGAGPMQSLFDPSRDGLPYFENLIAGDESFNGHHISWSLSDIPQRYLDALLNAEDATGLELDETAIDNLTRWAHRSLDNEVGVPACLSMTTFDTVPVVDPFNYREALYAMLVLRLYRNDEQAETRIAKLIATIDRYLDLSTGQWNEELFHSETGWRTYQSSHAELQEWGFTPVDLVEGSVFPRTFGRYIGGLVKVHKALGTPGALAQALGIASYCIQNILDSSGAYRPESQGTHVHSITSMLSGLALLGEVVDDRDILDTVDAFCRNGLQELSLEFGWSTENVKRTNHYGEVNNTADIVETFLALGRAGYPGYYERVERMVRGHLLPSQLLDTSFISNLDVPEEDYHHRLADRCLGAFGFPCPYGHEYETDGWLSFNWDITGGAVSGLCEVVRSQVVAENNLTSVNLLFDYDGDEARVDSPYREGHDGELVITNRSDRVLRVRLASWSGPDDVQLIVAPSGVRLRAAGEWVYIDGLGRGETATLHYPLAIRIASYPVKSDTFTVQWRGDSIESATSLGRHLCFFPELDTMPRARREEMK